jgi:hypothetical protein
VTATSGVPAGWARAAGQRQQSPLRSLRPWLLFAMFGPLLAIAFRSSRIDVLDRMIAGATWLLCLWPAWRYVNAPPALRRPVPFFPVIGVAFGCYFALQVVLGAINLYGRFEVASHVPELDPVYYSRAVPLVFLGWCALLAGHELLGRRVRPPRGDRRSEELLLPRLAIWASGLLLLSLLIEVTKRTLPLSGGIRGLLYFLSSLTGVALALLVALAVQRRLPRALRIPLFVGIGVTVLLQASTGASQVVMLTVLTLGMAVLLAGGRLTWRWIAVGVAGVLLFAAMRGVALEHRRATMVVASGADEPVQTALLFVLIGDRIEREGIGGTVFGGLEVATARSALTDLFADVIRQTPEVVPFWGGETYKSLIGAFVPRALWPGKPTKTLGYQFGHRYGYLRADDFTTTINLPFLIEFYANFAAMGVAVGMFIVGLIYGALDRFFNQPGQSTIRSLYALALTVPLVNVESDFSLVFGGLFLNGCATYVLFWLARQRAPRVARPERGGGAPARPRTGEQGPGPHDPLVVRPLTR